jgi:hypothetical protein
MLAMPPLLMEINSHQREVAETLIQVGLGLGSQAGILTPPLEAPIVLRFEIPSGSKEAGTSVIEQPS